MADRTFDCHTVRTAPTSSSQLGLRMGVAATVGLFTGAATFMFIKQREEEAGEDYKDVIGKALGYGLLVGTGAGLAAHLIFLGAMWAARTTPMRGGGGAAATPSSATTSPAKTAQAPPLPPPAAPSRPSLALSSFCENLA